MPRASSSISSESPSQSGKPRWALPGSRWSTSPCRWASGTTSVTRRTRSSRSAAIRSAYSGWALTACSTAVAKPAMAGMSRVPLRMSRSWPPPWSSGVRSSRRSTSAPTPYGPPSLWPVRVSASTPLAAKSTGTAPTAWTASVCTGMPWADASATTSSIGWSVPTSLLAHITEISGDGRRVALDSLADGGRVEPAVAVDGQQLDDAPAPPPRASAGCRGRRGARSRGEDPVARGVRLTAGPEDPLSARLSDSVPPEVNTPRRAGS